jgi:hypothetical protein
MKSRTTIPFYSSASVKRKVVPGGGTNWFIVSMNREIGLDI